MNQTLQRLQEIEKNGYQIDFGKIFNDAFENYKKIVLYAGLVLFISIFLIAIFAFITSIYTVGLENLKTILSPENLKAKNPFETNALIIQIVSIIASCLLSPFQASFFKMALYGDRDEAFHISDLFSYYKSPYFSKIILTVFLISIINFTQTLLFTLIHFEFLGAITTFFISFITILTIPLIIFGDLSIADSIKYSTVVVFKQPIVILGLVVISIIGAIVGVMGCCVGLFFTIPFVFSMNYMIYSAIVGIDAPEEIQQQEQQ